MLKMLITVEEWKPNMLIFIYGEVRERTFHKNLLVKKIKKESVIKVAMVLQKEGRIVETALGQVQSIRGTEINK